MPKGALERLMEFDYDPLGGSKDKPKPRSPNTPTGALALLGNDEQPNEPRRVTRAPRTPQNEPFISQAGGDVPPYKLSSSNSEEAARFLTVPQEWPGYKTTEVILDEDANKPAPMLWIRLEPNIDGPRICKNCKNQGEKSEKEGYWTSVHDLPCFDANTKLEIPIRWVWCPVCNNTHQEDVSWLNDAILPTRRLERHITQLHHHIEINHIANLYNIPEERLNRFLK